MIFWWAQSIRNYLQLTVTSKWNDIQWTCKSEKKGEPINIFSCYRDTGELLVVSDPANNNGLWYTYIVNYL